MPFATRLSLLNETARNHPVIVATSAATGGVLLGAFVMFQVFAVPHPRAEGIVQAAVESKAVSKAQIETTGSAPSAQNDAGKAVSADCERQTWPYLSPTCIEETRAKNRSARVVSTDKIEKPAVAAVEGTAADAKNDSSLAAPAPWTPTVATTLPPVVAPPIATADTSQRRAVKKAKRKPRSEQAVAERNTDDDDEMSAASVERDDRAGRRADRRRIVERHYDVAEEDGGGRRRIIVIRRGGGPFESLFGMGRRGDDD